MNGDDIAITTADRLAFGRAVRELRGRRGTSVRELAWDARVHERYLAAIERGELEPTLRTMVRIADGLDLSLTELAARYERWRARVRDAART